MEKENPGAAFTARSGYDLTGARAPALSGKIGMILANPQTSKTLMICPDREHKTNPEFPASHLFAIVKIAWRPTLLM